MASLTDEQLQRVRDFFDSEEGRVLWSVLEDDIMSKWILSQTTAERETCWHQLQALQRLHDQIRFAGANKKLTERSQNAQGTATTENYTNS